jgi:3-deoxy-D-manno-octulosonic-acid transferase
VALKPGTVFLLNSIGELANVYSLASIAFVGGSLVPAGGHNPLEPAQFGVPIVMGPYYENFRAIVQRLLEGEAIKVAKPETLVPTLAMLLNEGEVAGMLGVRALEIFDSQAGATERALSALLSILPARAARQNAPQGAAP